MITVNEQLATLDAAAASGAIDRLCQDHSVEMLVLFGSAVDTENPGDIDVAVGFQHGVEADLLMFIDALNELVPGNHLDVLDLNRAGPVALHRSLTHCRVLFAKSMQAFYDRQIFAINHYIETKPLRDLLLKSLAS